MLSKNQDIVPQKDRRKVISPLLMHKAVFTGRAVVYNKFLFVVKEFYQFMSIYSRTFTVDIAKAVVVF